MEFKSIQKYILTSPQKLREVSALARKMKPDEAIEKLPFLHKRATSPIIKVIKSAVANAKQKGVNIDALEFKEIQINEGPRLKRWRAGARGRAKPYKRRMSHIRVVLTTGKFKASQESRKQVRSSRREKSVRDDKAGVKSLPALPKSKISRKKNV